MKCYIRFVIRDVLSAMRVYAWSLSTLQYYEGHRTFTQYTLTLSSFICLFLSSLTRRMLLRWQLVKQDKNAKQGLVWPFMRRVFTPSKLSLVEVPNLFCSYFSFTKAKAIEHHPRQMDYTAKYLKAPHHHCRALVAEWLQHINPQHHKFNSGLGTFFAFHFCMLHAAIFTLSSFPSRLIFQISP